MPIKNKNKKKILAKKGRQTKWAPVWAVLKKYGMGKRVHPSTMTKYKRSWRRTKLHIRQEKGENRTSDKNKMVLNREYNEKMKIHQGIDRSEDSENTKEANLNDESETPKLFIVRGKPDFSDLNLREYGWKRINDYTPERKKLLKDTPGYKDYKELIIYEGPQGIAVVNANYRKDKHKVDIYFNNSTKEYSDRLNAVKFMFEREWGYKLEDPIEEETSNLVKKVKSN